MLKKRTQSNQKGKNLHNRQQDGQLESKKAGKR